MYVGALPVVAFLLRRAVSESSAALLRRSLLGEFLFRFPLSGVDAARAGWHGSLAHGGGRREGGREGNRPYRTASIADEQRDFTPAVGQLIIDGLLTR